MIRKMRVSKLKSKVLASVVIFHYHRVSWCKLQIYGFDGLLDLSVGVYTDYQARRSTQRQLKMTHINFAILCSHVTINI